MSVTPTTFKARYAEFSTETDARVQVFIDDAELELHEGTWGTLYDRGLSALTAHFLAVSNQSAASSGTGSALPGKLASRAVGSVAVSFTNGASTGSTADYYMSTSYGADYWRLVQLVGLGVIPVAE